MTLRIFRASVASRILSRVVQSGFCLAALAFSGCADSTMQPKDTVQATPPGASLAPGGEIKSNTKTTQSAVKAEPQ